MKGVIYKWTNIINNKVYIGQTIDYKRRYREFICEDKYYTSNNINNLSKIDKARIKYGINNFNYQILEEFEIDDKQELLNRLNELEEYYINQYNSIQDGYNTVKEGGSYIHKDKSENINKGGRIKLDYKIQNNIVYLPHNFKGTPKLAFLYLIIQLYKNNEISVVPLSIISEFSELSIPTVRLYLKQLEELNYLKINYNKSPIQYEFILDNIKDSEPFSDEFLKKKDISPTTKSYLIAAQQFMFKNIKGVGKISYPNTSLSQQINMPESTIRECNKELERKNYLTIINNKSRDLETGCKTDTKLYDLNKLGQAIIWTLKDHEDRITENTENINELIKKDKEKDKLIEAMQREIEELKKTSQNNFVMN